MFLNIRTDVSGSIGSVVMELDGFVKMERWAPYSLGESVLGDYNAMPQLTVLGAHTVRATPFSGDLGTGEEGALVSLNIVII